MWYPHVTVEKHNIVQFLTFNLRLFDFYSCLSCAHVLKPSKGLLTTQKQVPISLCDRITQLSGTILTRQRHKQQIRLDFGRRPSLVRPQLPHQNVWSFIAQAASHFSYLSSPSTRRTFLPIFGGGAVILHSLVLFPGYCLFISGWLSF